MLSEGTHTPRHTSEDALDRGAERVSSHVHEPHGETEDVSSSSHDSVDKQARTVPVRLPQSRAWITYTLIGLNVLVYLVTAARSLNLFTPRSSVLQELGWKENELILQGQWWRLITSTFLHGNLAHIAINMIALLNLGRDVEMFFGAARMAAIYALAGLGGSLLSYAISPYPSVGASGAIFGLFGAMIIFLLRQRELFGTSGRRHLESMGFMLLINFMIGFSAGTHIDNWAHMGGLAAGALAALALTPRFTVALKDDVALLERQTPLTDWVGAALLGGALVGVFPFIRPPL